MIKVEKVAQATKDIADRYGLKLLELGGPYPGEGDMAAGLN